jgi:hypothetical protein
MCASAHQDCARVGHDRCLAGNDLLPREAVLWATSAYLVAVVMTPTMRARLSLNITALEPFCWCSWSLLSSAQS